MSLRLVTAPSEEPVSLEEAKAHLRVSFSDDDALIGTLITAARENVEAYLKRALISQSWEIACDRFPAFFILPMGRVTAIESFTYIDAAGATTTVPASVYETDFLSEPARVRVKDGQRWPHEGDVINAVQLRYTVGAPDAASVAPSVKHAILMLVATLYEHRESQFVNLAVAANPVLSQLLFPHAVHGT